MENDIKKFYEQHKTLIWIIGIVVIGLIFIILFPVAIQFLIDRDSTHKGSDDGWLGFWGGYLGSIIGVAGALIAIQIQLYNEKQARKSEQVDNTFFNLLNMFINQQNKLISEQNSKQDLFKEMLEKIKIESSVAYRKQGLCQFYKNKSEILSVLDKSLKASEQYVDDKMLILNSSEKGYLINIRKNEWLINEPENIHNIDFKNALTEVKRINRIQELRKKIDEEKYFEMNIPGSAKFGIKKILEQLKEFNNKNELLDLNSRKVITENYDFLEEYTKPTPNIELESNRKKNAVENAQEPHRKQVGSYFRIFHRIIKYLNENVDDKEIKKNYIGFLRASMNESQMAMIFYNIYYTERGSGALKELRGTGFFGDKSELNDLESAHFFSPETLVWGKDDLVKMKEFC